MVSPKDLCPRNCEGILSEKTVFDINRFAPQMAATNHQFSSVAQSCPTLCDPMNRSTPGLPVHHQLHDTKSLDRREGRAIWFSDVSFSQCLDGDERPTSGLSW